MGLPAFSIVLRRRPYWSRFRQTGIFSPVVKPPCADGFVRRFDVGFIQIPPQMAVERVVRNIFCGGSCHLIRLNNIKGTQNAMLCRYVRQNVDSYVPGDLPVLMRERIKQHL